MQRVARLEAQMQQMQQDQGTFASRVNQKQGTDDARMGTIESTIRGSQEAIRIEFDRSAAQRAAQFASLIADATAEFDKQRKQQQDIVDAVQLELNKLQQQIEQGSSKDNGNKNGKSFLPVKELKPPKLCKEEQWRDWSEHFSEFLEASCSGMKECLKEVAKAETKPDAETVACSTFGHLADRTEALYSALKHLTEEGSAARRVITSTPREDGYSAWWSLCSTFTQALAARQGAVMSQFTNTHSKPGKIPADTRIKLIEVDNATKRWSEVMGEKVP